MIPFSICPSVPDDGDILSLLFQCISILNATLKTAYEISASDSTGWIDHTEGTL